MRRMNSRGYCTTDARRGTSGSAARSVPEPGEVVIVIVIMIVIVIVAVAVAAILSQLIMNFQTRVMNSGILECGR